MGKQAGIIRLEGNLGGISFYKTGGKYVARVSSGPSKERIATEANFQRTRENNKEFGGCARIGKALRLSLGAFARSMGSPKVTGKMNAAFKRINLQATTGKRGKRPIHLSENKEMLRNFEFNAGTTLHSVFSAPFTSSINAERNRTTIIVPEFNPKTYIKAPTGATHFQLISVIGAVSDYVYNDETESYEALVPQQDSPGGIVRSELLSLHARTAVISLITCLPGGLATDDACSVVQALGILFFQEVGVEQYVLAEDKALKIVEVF